MSEGTNTKAKTITVSINDHDIEFTVLKATGAEIKATAIVQGLSIEQDFVLHLVQGTNLPVIGDEDEVTLHPNQEFRAVAPDDNS